MTLSKVKVFSTLTVCGLALLMASPALADETDVAGTIGDTTIVTPSQSTPASSTPSSSTSDEVAGTVTDDSTKPSSPVTESSTSSTENTTETIGGSQTETTDEENTPQELPQPSEENKDTSVSVSTVDGGTTTVVPNTSVPTNNPHISAETAQEVGASQVGTTSTVTGQVVRDVTTASPVTLSNGTAITDIRDGLVTLSTGEKVTPESVNLTPNSDGTYTAKTIQGDLVTLPHTGEKANPILAVLGILTVMISVIVAFKDKMMIRVKKVLSRQS